jgi:hypothetical protein
VVPSFRARPPIFLAAAAACLLLLIGTLAISSQLSSHAFVSGSVYAGLSPGVNQPVIFITVDGQHEYVTHGDSNGNFSISLPPGEYKIAASLACAPFSDCSFISGPKSVNLAAGEHLKINLATCGDLWQCPR